MSDEYIYKLPLNPEYKKPVVICYLTGEDCVYPNNLACGNCPLTSKNYILNLRHSERVI